MNYRGQTELPTEIEKVLDQIAEEKIGYQPTIQVMQGLRGYFDPEYLKMTAILKVFPAEMPEWFESPEGKWLKKEIAEDNAPDAAIRGGMDLGPIRSVRQVVAYLAGKDVNFPFGTDTPSAPKGNFTGQFGRQFE